MLSCLRNRPGRGEWLTRSEAAKILLSALALSGKAEGRDQPTAEPARHVRRSYWSRFYMARRAGAVCAAALEPTEGRGGGSTLTGALPAPTRRARRRNVGRRCRYRNRLLAHLRRWHRLGQRAAVEWNGQPVKRRRQGVPARSPKAAGLPEVTPHILRHTAATWLMQLGTDKWEAAEYLGMTAKQLDDTYGHHHPDHLRGPRDAFDRPPPLAATATGREQTQSNVTKIANNLR